MMARVPSGDRTQIDLSRGSLPILAALTLLCFVAASAYGVGSLISGLTTDRDQGRERFLAIDMELKTIKGLIDNGNVMRKAEFDLWCRNAEFLNKGFKCGNTK